MQLAESPRKSSAERVRRHYAKMRARGFRRVTVWVSSGESASDLAEALRRQTRKRDLGRRLTDTDLCDDLLAAFEAR